MTAAPKRFSTASSFRSPIICTANATGTGKTGHDLAITGIKREGSADDLAVPTGDLEAIRGPPQVGPDRDDLTVVRATWLLFDLALQEQSVLRHRPVEELVWSGPYLDRTVAAYSIPLGVHLIWPLRVKGRTNYPRGVPRSMCQDGLRGSRGCPWLERGTQREVLWRDDGSV